MFLSRSMREQKAIKPAPKTMSTNTTSSSASSSASSLILNGTVASTTTLSNNSTNNSDCSDENQHDNVMLSRHGSRLHHLKKESSSSSRAKVVVAKHNYKPVNDETDLPLDKGEEYSVMCDTIPGCPGWWRVKNKYGNVGLIPSNYVEEKSIDIIKQSNNSNSTTSSSNISGSKSDFNQCHWFLPDLDRESAERLLRADGREGVFVVRHSSTQELFTISLLVRVARPADIKHYLIRRSKSTDAYYLSEHHLFSSVEELVRYHRHDAGSLAVRLKHSPNVSQAVHLKLNNHRRSLSKLLHGDKSWEIRVNELSLLEELGSGQFGVVRKGRWTRVVDDAETGRRRTMSCDVAVKLMKEGTMSEQDFVREAKVMTRLKHPNLVQLFGLCVEHRPICIVTEFMKFGSLLSFLRRKESQLRQTPQLLLSMCLQVCEGMAYLEARSYIHRDLAARNCLVGDAHVVKVADFGLTRFVADSNEYTSSSGTKFPIKWAPPEVLWFTKFSSKSDVWAFGVLMWEVFSCGQMPYGRATNAQVVEQIRCGKRLARPPICPRPVFEIMEACWREEPERRPSFADLNTKLKHVLDC